MDTTVSLQPDFANKGGMVWLLGLFLLVTFIYWLSKIQKKKPAKTKKQKVNSAKPSNAMNPIQIKYINMIKRLQIDSGEVGFSVKQGYQELSQIYRNFIEEYTGLEVTNKTLSELKEMGKPVIADIIEIYYAPEFDNRTYGKEDFIDAIDRTSEAIRQWK